MLRTQYGSEQINERASAAFQVPASIAPLSWLTFSATFASGHAAAAPESVELAPNVVEASAHISKSQ
jgi:hypothetical protein